MGEIPEDRDERRAFLERWAKVQKSRLASAERSRLHAEELSRALAQARQRLGQLDHVQKTTAVPVVITKASNLPADRAAVFADLMKRLREHKWADPIVSECDEPRYIAPQAIELARRHCPNARWLLYMEDDVIVGPDFGLLPGLLSEAEQQSPDAGLVSFYSGRIVEPGWSVHPMNLFGALQCAAIRNSDYLAGFRAFIDHSMTRSPYGVTQSAGKYLLELPDAAVQAFLSVEYDAYALWCPSLVQHADVTSALFGEPMRRRISSSYDQAYG